MSGHIENMKRPEPFDSFQMVFKLLIGVGCCKLLEPPSSRFKLYCYNLYRAVYFALLAMVNIQQITYIFVSSKNVNTLFEVLVIEIPLMNIMMKSLTLFIRSRRIDKLHEVIRGPYFAAKGPKDEEYLNQNKINMEKVVKAMTIDVVLVIGSWLLSHFVRKMNGEFVPIPMYVPFESESWMGFSLLAILRVGITGYLGFSNLIIDSLIAIYFSQSTVQLKILKYNLEHMFDEEDGNRASDRQIFVYKDKVDVKLKERFIYYVQRYEQIMCFTEEVKSVFNFALSFQIITITMTTCFVIFNMSNATALSVQFMFLMTIFSLFQFEIFLYCFFGSLLEYEHQSVCQSAFNSDWIALSPSFRRNLLIAMARWTQPLRICVSVIVPLTINTSIVILRAAYTLFTLLTKTGNEK